MPPEGPLLYRRRLGTELRQLRGARSLEEVAAATLISTSKLSRLENGQGVPQPRDIRDLVNYYELDTQAADRLRRWASAGRSQAWWLQYSGALLSGQGNYIDLESGASTIRSYASSIIPPLLQTEVYATRLLEALPVVDDGSVRRLVELAGRRQERVVDSEAALHLSTVLDEAVLRRPFGSLDDRREQLDHLIAVSRQRNVSLQILPFSAGLHAGLQGLFTILQYADDRDRDVVSVESHTGERILEQPSDVLEYLRIFDAIVRKALSHDESRAFIAEIRDRSHSPKGMP